jgi:hypothetical protein
MAFGGGALSTLAMRNAALKAGASPAGTSTRTAPGPTDAAQVAQPRAASTSTTPTPPDPLLAASLAAMQAGAAATRQRRKAAAGTLATTLSLGPATAPRLASKTLGGY